MTERPDKPYADQTRTPSTRITAARAQEIIDLFVGYPDLEPLHRADAESVVSLGRDIQRLQTILIGLDGLLLGPDAWCSWCQRSFVGAGAKHDEGCPIGQAEAEIGALQQEFAERELGGQTHTHPDE